MKHKLPSFHTNAQISAMRCSQYGFDSLARNLPFGQSGRVVIAWSIFFREIFRVVFVCWDFNMFRIRYHRHQWLFTKVVYNDCYIVLYSYWSMQEFWAICLLSIFLVLCHNGYEPSHHPLVGDLYSNIESISEFHLLKDNLFHPVILKKICYLILLS